MIDAAMHEMVALHPHAAEWVVLAAYRCMWWLAAIATHSAAQPRYISDLISTSISATVEVMTKCSNK